MYCCPEKIVLCCLVKTQPTPSQRALLRNIDLQRTAERSFPSWKGPSGVGCKPNFVTPVESINKLDTARAEETLAFVTSVR